MGGHGSGRSEDPCSRFTTADYVRADLAELRRTYGDGPFRGALVELWGIAVRLDRTVCTLGGTRTWFVCDGCARRARVLFKSGPLMRCRCCLDLAYPSQRMGARDRAMEKARKIRVKLGRTGHPLESRLHSKGMHAGTRRRLVDELLAAEEVVTRETAAKFAKMRRRLGLGLE